MFVLVCIYVYVFDDCSALQSRVDFELLEEYQEPSSAQFEQKENFEEGKYNMNTTYHF